MTTIGTIGAVAINQRSLLLPALIGADIPYWVKLAGAGGTTEIAKVRSYADRDGNVSVERGAEGSVPVAHTAPVTVTQYDPNAGGGGGGVTVTGSQGGPVEATSILTAFEVTDNGGGEAGINGTIRAPDGAEGTADLLFEIQGETGQPLLQVDPYGALILKGAKVDPTNGGPYFSMIGTVNGATIVSITADDGNGGSSAFIGQASTALAFFGASPVARPEVPAIVTAQDIVDALVALGLVTQAS